MICGFALNTMGCAFAPVEQGDLLATLDEGFFMSEQKIVQPSSGTAGVDGAMLSWSIATGTLSYKITVEVLNACYRAGRVEVEIDKNAVILNATVDYEKAMCAQVLQEITFEGDYDTPPEGFVVKANIFDLRTGRTIVIE